MTSSSTYLAGDAPEDVKIAAVDMWDNWIGGPAAPGFGKDVRKGMRFTTLNLKEEALSSGDADERPRRRTAETIHEVTVTEDFLNGMGFLHGGCTAYLIDSCSSIGFVALSPPDTPPSVSLNLAVTYHQAAPPGARLRFISTVIAFSARVQTVRCEVWDITKPAHRLVATGTHIKMQQSGRTLPGSDAQGETATVKAKL